MQRFKNSVRLGPAAANMQIGALVDAGAEKLPADPSSKEDRFYVAAEYRNPAERGSIGIYSAAELADGKPAENGKFYKVHDQGESGRCNKGGSDCEKRQRRHGNPGHGQHRSDQNVDA